ncbi:hypothetical protein EST38_g4703 [Candolleomyces aberdarensis]|uniref:Uncharacterized protein n=1 Tax=Candolleomyces aberdarensis TaxID=2316362 RepID=A0A4Q2DPP8_9AGAR|nr:hypothetical protein EST38_g4703 [Candolleomyces aberdarensis]
MKFTLPALVTLVFVVLQVSAAPTGDTPPPPPSEEEPVYACANEAKVFTLRHN